MKFLKNFIFKVICFLKMCAIFLVHNFGRSDDAYFPWMHTWFDAQLDQKILDGIYCCYSDDDDPSKLA